MRNIELCSTSSCRSTHNFFFQACYIHQFRIAPMELFSFRLLLGLSFAEESEASSAIKEKEEYDDEAEEAETMNVSIGKNLGDEVNDDGSNSDGVKDDGDGVNDGSGIIDGVIDQACL